MNSPDLTKENARKAAYAARRMAKTAQNDARAQDHLLAALSAYRGRALAGYMAIRTEVDPLPVMARMARFGPVCVPVIQGAARPLLFRAWHPGCEMVAGPFGAQVPKSGDWITPEVVIVPLVGFGAQGARLGYGGGFYDRTLEGLRAGGDVWACGFAFEEQRLDDLPQEPTDQKLDALVTQQGLIAFD